MLNIVLMTAITSLLINKITYQITNSKYKPES